MKKEKIRLALIGAGGMANSVHYPSLLEFPDVEMAGISDLMEEKLKATADKFHIEKTFTDYKKMLDEIEPDAVYILMLPHHRLLKRRKTTNDQSHRQRKDDGIGG